MNIDCCAVGEVSDEARGAWSEICRRCAAFHSPFFRPEFAVTVARIRPDVHVGIVRDGERYVGFFPFERDSRGHGRPVAGPLSDFQALIAEEGVRIDPRWLLHACDLRAYHFDHWLVDPPRMPITSDRVETSPYLDLSQGFDAYTARRRAMGGTRHRRIATIARKFAREVGDVTFTADDPDPAAWDALFRWKSEQYEQTGVINVFSYPWVSEVLHAIHHARGDGFQGMMMTLRAGGRLAAVHFGMRTERTVHWWFPAYNPELSRYSPGMILLLRAAEAMATEGCHRIDLGAGDEAYKGSVATDATEVAEGTIDRGGVGPWLRRGGKSVYELLRRMPGKHHFQRPARMLYDYRRRRDFRG